MKILIVCNCASGLSDFRGMLICQLIERGHEVYAIIPQTDEVAEKKSEKMLESYNCKLIRIVMESRGMNPVKDIKLLQRYIKEIYRKKPDLVITYTIKPNAYGGIACRLCKVPYVANITGLGKAFQNEGLLRRFVSVLYKIAFRRAKVVFFENIENQQVILEAGIIRREQACLLNGAGVDLEKYSYQAYPNDNGEIRFLFIGRIMKEKGVDELFEAMKKLRTDGVNCCLQILGRFNDGYDTIIKEYEQEGWLKYGGYQSDVRPYITNSHCFVLPSYHEGMANTNLEAAAMGRPLITSRIHGCMEAVEDGVSGYLCEKENTENLYEVLKQFVQLSEEQKRAMGVAGRKRMERLFDKKNVVKRTLEKINCDE